jgi:hypothetical protein
MSVGGILIGGWLASFKTLHSEAWICLFLVPLLLVGLYLTVAAMFGIPPARPEIAADHRGALLTLVGRVAGSDADAYGGSAERQIMRAHYAGIATVQSRLAAAVRTEREAWDALKMLLESSAVKEFPPTEYWLNGGILAKGVHRLNGKSARAKLREGEIGVRQVALGDASPPRHLNWDDHVVWDPTRGSPEASASDAEFAAKTTLIEDWFQRMGESSQAETYRDALRNVAALRMRLADEMEPIHHHAPVLYSRRCFICRPKRRWQFWR